MQRETLRAPSRLAQEASPPLASQGIPSVLIGSRIQYRVHNDSDRPVYLVLLGLDSSRNAIALLPTAPVQETNGSETKPALKDFVISPAQTLTVPQNSVDFEWVVRGPAGLAETQLIFSSANFTQTLAALEAAMHSKEEEDVGPLLNPLEVAQAVLQDLHQASPVKAESTSTDADTYALDVNDWASLSFVYKVA